MAGSGTGFDGEFAGTSGADQKRVGIQADAKVGEGDRDSDGQDGRHIRRPRRTVLDVSQHGVFRLALAHSTRGRFVLLGSMVDSWDSGMVWYWKHQGAGPTNNASGRTPSDTRVAQDNRTGQERGSCHVAR